MKNLVPDLIIDNFINKRFHGKFWAYTIFVDISGFTQITGSLMGHGKEGAEILSKIINEVFTPSIKSVYDNGGFVASFAGDAFTAVFPVDKADHPLKAALAIRAQFIDRGMIETKFGKFDLTIRIGLSCGQVEYRILDTDIQTAYYFRGEAIDNCAKSEHKAQKMQIVADSSFIEGISVSIEKNQIDKNCCIIDTEINQIADYQMKEMFLPDSNAEYRFKPKAVFELREKGEFREIVSCFINFSEEGDFQEKIKVIINSCHNYGGYFNCIDFGDKGGVILTLFGAPMGKEKLYQRAADFVLSLREIAGFKFKAGISKGISWTGFVGSKDRQEYTALGAKVNLSARLMQEADWGQIFTGPEICQNLTDQYNLISTGKRKLKGFMESIEIFALESRKAIRKHITFQGQFVGRNAETRLLKKAISPIFQNKFGGIVYIDGEPGVGKTRFIQDFLENNKSFDYFILNCDEILKKSFNPFEHLLRQFFNQSEYYTKDQNKANFLKKYENIIENTPDTEIKQELVRTESIIGALIKLEWENSLYSTLDAIGRYENTLYAVKNFIKSRCFNRPLILVFEDCHFIDSDSIQLLEILVRNVDNCPFIVLALCRPMDDGSRFVLFKENGTDTKAERIELKTFHKEMMSEFLARNLLTGKIPKETEDFIWEKSEGNPFFIEQIVYYLKENSVLDSRNNLTNLANAVPSGISQIIVSRVDRLSVKLKDTVKTASVLGREFALHVLKELLFKVRLLDGDLDFIEQIQRGNRELLWESIAELRYIFRHALIRDTIYEIQLKESLRNLHNLAGTIIEELYAGSSLKEHFEELAEHFEKAENTEKLLLYLEKAGDQAKDNYQNKKAIDFYQRLLKHLRLEKDQVKTVHILQKKGEILTLIGSWNETEIVYEEAIEIASQHKDQAPFVDIMNSMGALLHDKGKPDEAMQMLQKSFSLAEKIGHRKGVSDAAGSIGNIYWKQGDYSKAMEYYGRKLKICSHTADRKGISTAIGNMGIVHWTQGDHKQAMQCYEKQLQMCEELHDKKGLSLALGNIGLIHSRQGNFTKAMEYYKRKLEICEELGYKKGISAAVVNMGNDYWKQGIFSKANECFDRHLRICEELGDKSGISMAIGNLGIIHYIKGEFPKALQYYEKQLELSKKLGDKKTMITAVGNIGTLYARQAEHQKALEYYDQKLTLCKELGDRSGMNITYSNMGYVYSEKGDFDKAIEYYEQKASLSKELNDNTALNTALLSIGLAYQNKGETALARKYYQKQLKIVKQLKDQIGAGKVLKDIGTTYKYEGNKSLALDFYDKSIEAFEKTGSKSDLAEVLYYKAGLLYDSKAIDDAKSLINKALSIASGLNKHEVLIKIKVMHSRIYSDHDSMDDLLRENKESEEIAAMIFYEKWKMTQKEEYRKKAWKLNSDLLKLKHKFEYKFIMKELEKKP